MRRISGFIISVLLLLPVWCGAQDTVRYPVNEMKGIRIGVDISKLLLPVIYSGERMGFEATADMHIKGNLFGAAEAGWLYVNLDDTAYHYRENGLYGKIGADYNLLKSRRPNSNDIVYAGVRYGLSVFSQQAGQVTIPGHFWPDATGHSIPKNTMQAHWLELLFGVKAEVLKNLYAGLTFRVKFKIVSPKDNYSTPYQVPGFGNGNSGFSLGINYYVSYNIRF
ncbi:MAG: DUF6048 family protein [Bacteroidales bacterium]|jgi:hypothetical protein|nr:DUF6048 family protein [Bacteroidales bacterium]